MDDKPIKVWGPISTEQQMICGCEKTEVKFPDGSVKAGIKLCAFHIDRQRQPARRGESR